MQNGRVSLGDSIYRSITVEFFDPDQLLSTMDLSSEHKILDLKNRIEASIVIWKRKMNQKDGKSAWGSAVSLEKRELFEERAETILLILKQRFPGIPQSSLDISKIQYNRVRKYYAFVSIYIIQDKFTTRLLYILFCFFPHNFLGMVVFVCDRLASITPNKSCMC